MNKFEKKYPKIFKTLTDAGVGKRKARRMIRMAVFTQDGLAYDTPYADFFCIWFKQGSNFLGTWMHVSKVQYNAK